MKKTIHRLLFLMIFFTLGVCGSIEENIQNGTAWIEEEQEEVKVDSLDSIMPISDELEPQEIARILVDQEMSKQVALKNGILQKVW